MGLTAIHVWKLRSLSAGLTRVQTDESMSGFPSSLFYSSEELGQANASWLANLKTVVERDSLTHPHI